ncbi:hypothetical protein HN695_02080 [Candidatus Woesearchaeota archaeon]|jgi:hypothetical protein|nr:hypothetical protein [Candidatus Woesearchaeota archaeon]MBT5272875.1 hypothetical protein [Candidatus Woesearchaeota archaeon]MBT6041341.1 hypothetical protein [Candidatus Woesearchaeota archaeon]MBT6337224.1 hypothetical protein [Candidatus Woesearchaeota archaeon]MBT7927101.1 hypothetical protein [Candidatus Woesearchaeota archaeon]
MIKKRGIYIIILLILFILLANNSISPDFTDKGSGIVVEDPETPAQVETAAQAGTPGVTTQVDADIETPHGTEAHLPKDTDMESDGNTLTLSSDGEITDDGNSFSNTKNLMISELGYSAESAESIQTDIVTATGVEGYTEMKGTGYVKATHADAIQIGTTTLTNVDNLEIGSKIEFDHADYVKTDEFEAFNISEFSQDATNLEMKSVETLTTECLELTGLEDSKVIVDDDKLFTKTQSVNLNDCVNQNTMFQGFDESSAIIVTKEKPSHYSISKGILTLQLEEIDEILTTKSTSAATVNEYGFSMLELNPLSSYLYKNKVNKMLDFKIETNNEEFLFFTRKNGDTPPDISFCDQCGFIDFIEKKIELKGIITFSKRIGTSLETFFQGFKSTHAEFLMNENKFSLVKINGDAFTKPATWLEIHERDGHRIVNLLDEPSDSIISLYSSEDNPDLVYENNNKRFVMEKGKGRVEIYHPDNEVFP